MKLHLFVLSAITVMTLGSATPASADTTGYRIRGNSASATWIQYGNECSWSNLDINVTESVTRLIGSEAGETVMVNVNGSIYDMCYGSPNYGTQINFVGVNQAETVVDFTSAALRSAALKVTVPVNVYGSQGVYVGALAVDLSWVGTNAFLNSGTSTSRQVTPDGLYILHQTGVQRSATFTGTVLLDGTSLTNGDTFGLLYKATEGTLTIVR